MDRKTLDDGLEELGWLILVLVALGFLFVAVVYFLQGN
jgi:hypothetical protein